MNRAELIQKYKELALKNKLPSWDELDKEYYIDFAVCGWNEIPENTLLYIFNRLMDYYNSWINFCHTLINGNPQSMILMREAEFFDDEKKKEIIDVMRDLTIMSRRQTVVNLKNEADETITTIKELHKSWLKIKPKLQEYAEYSYNNWVEEGNRK